MPSDDKDDGSDPNDGERCADAHQRTLRTNMIFLVRYWDELKFDLDKVILLIKISLNDPSRFQSSKQQSIR